MPMLDTAGTGGSRRKRTALNLCTRLLPSLIALGGVALITAAPSADAGEAAENTPMGLAFSLASASFYAMHTLRLSDYGDVRSRVGVRVRVRVRVIARLGVFLRDAHAAAL